MPAVPPRINLRVTFEVPDLTRDPVSHNLVAGTKKVTATGEGWSERSAITAAKRNARISAVRSAKVLKIELVDADGKLLTTKLSEPVKTPPRPITPSR